MHAKLGDKEGQMKTSVDACGSGPSVKFRDAARAQQAITTSVERKALSWLAERTPGWVSPDHLTALGFLAQFFVGVSYALARWNRGALIAAAIFIALNWLGDSLDGTLARYRKRLRPRYGFYVDHVVDSFGAVFLAIGLAMSGYMHWQIAAGILVAFLVVSIESYLAAYTLSDFRLSHAFLGPTEIRILLVVGNFALLFWPRVQIFGREFLLFDVGGAIGAAGMMAMAVVAAFEHTARLYKEERII
jgi:archaetidylinositol phosphate synthase